MAHWLKVLAAKTDHMNSILPEPKWKKVEREEISKIVLSPPHKLCSMVVHVFIHKQTK